MEQFDNSRSRFAPFGFSCEIWKPREMSRADQHDEIELNYLPGSSLTYLLGGRRVTVPPRQLTVFWAVQPHKIINFDGDAPYYVITIPLSWFLSWGLPDDFRTRIIHGEIIADAGCQPELEAMMFERWSREVGREALATAAVLELQARMLRLAANAAPSLESNSNLKRATQFESQEKVEKMACYIAHHYRERVTLPEIAAHVDLHPDYAATLFRKTFGTTIVSLITRHRIAHSQRLLITGDNRIMSIAYESGFDSLSRFNKAFKDCTGLTPRQFRQGMRAN